MLFSRRWERCSNSYTTYGLCASEESCQGTTGNFTYDFDFLNETYWFSIVIMPTLLSMCVCVSICVHVEMSEYIHSEQVPHKYPFPPVLLLSTINVLLTYCTSYLYRDHCWMEKWLEELAHQMEVPVLPHQDEDLEGGGFPPQWYYMYMLVVVALNLIHSWVLKQKFFLITITKNHKLDFFIVGIDGEHKWFWNSLSLS